VLQQFGFTDEGKNRNQSFYRIKITAKDGSIVYTNTIGCNSRAGDNVIVYPNPVKTDVKMQLNSSYKEEANVFILSSDGRRVKNTSLSLKKGLNEISIPVTDLPSGNYVIRFSTNQQMISSKFIKN
jgi:hypothetical protein